MPSQVDWPLSLKFTNSQKKGTRVNARQPSLTRLPWQIFFFVKFRRCASWRGFRGLVGPSPSHNLWKISNASKFPERIHKNEQSFLSTSGWSLSFVASMLETYWLNQIGVNEFSIRDQKGRIANHIVRIGRAQKRLSKALPELVWGVSTQGAPCKRHGVTGWPKEYGTRNRSSIQICKVY